MNSPNGHTKGLIRTERDDESEQEATVTENHVEEKIVLRLEGGFVGLEEEGTGRGIGLGGRVSVAHEKSG
jgi:hypothetical protein